VGEAEGGYLRRYNIAAMLTTLRTTEI